MSSPFLVLEALVKPIRDGNTDIESHRELFAAGAVRLLDGSYEVFEYAAGIRAETGLKTPDEIHAATAIRAECALFITNDTDFRALGRIVLLADNLRCGVLRYGACVRRCPVRLHDRR